MTALARPHLNWLEHIAACTDKPRTERAGAHITTMPKAVQDALLEARYVEMFGDRLVVTERGRKVLEDSTKEAR